MGAREPLAVWLYGEHVATVERHRGSLRLLHSEAAQRRFGLNTPLLSLSMPVSGRPYGESVVAPFLDGLLPEGEVRRAVAYDLGLANTDTYALLAELGRDCAGALVVQPASVPPPVPVPLQRAEPIDEVEVARRLAGLGRVPLGIDDRVRLSLAGVQGKLLLVRHADGGWALPVNGVPSTHILKPAGALAHMVENEALCLRTARRAGLASAEVEIATIADRPVLVVTRFDRRHLASGEIVRVHQEDACQALSVAPERKYEEHGGPPLRRLASELRRWRVADEELEGLLRAVTLSVALGNADLHGKNLSFVHRPEGDVQLAPLYDVMCTVAYPWVSTVAGMFVNDVVRIDDMTPADLTAEGERWGMTGPRAAEVVGTLLEVLPGALEAAAAETPEAPEEIVVLLGARLRRVRDDAAHMARRRGRQPRPIEEPAPGEERVWVAPYRRADGVAVAGHFRARARGH